MKYLSIICLLILSSSCVTQFNLYSTRLTALSSASADTLIHDSLYIDVVFKGINNERLELDFSMINKSLDTIHVKPSSFYYRAVRTVHPDSLLPSKNYYCIDYKKEMDSLSQNKDSLSVAQNPYSDKGKSTCEVVKEGLTRGVVALLLPGISADDLEKQREEDEDDWDYNRDASLNSTNSQLTFWGHLALKNTILLEGDTVRGSLIFPIEPNLRELVVEIPIKDKTFRFPFRQKIKK